MTKMIPYVNSETPLKKESSIKNIVSSSKRLTLTYIVFCVWVSLAIFSIFMDADLYSLAVYFASGLPIILGYLWSETARPSIKDASELVKNINARPRQRNNPYGGGGYDDYEYYDNDYNRGRGRGNYNDSNVNVNNNNNQNSIDIVIYSNDASSSLKINQNQLETLKNIGYVNEINDKYTFEKGELNQIKSLIDSETQIPEI
jgi:hypothetical protein